MIYPPEKHSVERQVQSVIHTSVLICCIFYFSLVTYSFRQNLKKLFPIAFVAILLLNVMGYYGIFLGMQYRNDLAMVKGLDAEQYDDSQTITIKIPVSIPYMADQVDFARVDGKFEHQGEHYRLVKQKYAEDTLTVVCIRDHENERLNQAISNYVKTFGNKGSDQNENSKITLSFIKDFTLHTFTLSAHSTGWQTDVIKQGCANNLIPTFAPSIVHPPERA